jgi:flagellin
MISVNTNQGAMVALQTLNRTNSDLEKTQNAISTGLKVATAKDNGALWAIGNKLRSDVIAYDRVRESNDRASSVLDTAIAAGESIMELLNEMKGKALAGSLAGNSTAAQGALAADFLELRTQITNVIANASFDGANMIGITAPATAVANAVSLGDAAGTPGNNITVLGANLTLTAAAGAVLTITTASALTDTATSGTALTAVNTSINNLGTQLATWGAGARRLEVHKTFIGKLQDALTNGIGAIVDADLAKESAKLQSLQVKQQLGVQALSIANASSASALALFR